MAGQAVLRLDSQSDQYPTAFRGKVDATDLLVVFAVIDHQSPGNAEVLNRYSQSRADGVGAGAHRPGRTDNLTRPHVDHGGQPGPDSSIARYSGEQVVAHPDVMLAVVRDPDLVGHQGLEVGQQIGLTTFLELPFPFPAQDEQGLGQLLQIRPDRKSTRLNSSHLGISYAVFCLKKK